MHGVFVPRVTHATASSPGPGSFWSSAGVALHDEYAAGVALHDGYAAYALVRVACSGKCSGRLRRNGPALVTTTSEADLSACVSMRESIRPAMAARVGACWGSAARLCSSAGSAPTSYSSGGMPPPANCTNLYCWERTTQRAHWCGARPKSRAICSSRSSSVIMSTSGLAGGKEGEGQRRDEEARHRGIGGEGEGGGKSAQRG